MYSQKRYVNRLSVCIHFMYVKDLQIYTKLLKYLIRILKV